MINLESSPKALNSMLLLLFSNSWVKIDFIASSLFLLNWLMSLLPLLSVTVLAVLKKAFAKGVVATKCLFILDWLK